MFVFVSVRLRQVKAAEETEPNRKRKSEERQTHKQRKNENRATMANGESVNHMMNEVARVNVLAYRAAVIARRSFCG